MKVIMLSGDSFILDSESNVRKRIVEYGTQASELHILLLSKKIPPEIKAKRVQISANTWVYPIASEYRIWAMFIGLLKGIRLLSKIKPKKNSDIITSQDAFEIGLLAWILSILSRLPLQLQVHNDFYNPYFVHESKASNVRKWLAEFLLPRADNIRVVNHTIKDQLIGTAININPDKITLLPVYVDSDYISNHNPDFDLKMKYPQFSGLVLMVGRLGVGKNYPLAFNVLKKLVILNAGIGLIIIGDGSEENRLKKLVKKMGLSLHVVFEGRQNDVVSYYKGADVFLHTSNYEGYGMVFIEAAAAGIPMVSTAVGIMGSVFKHNESALIAETEDATTLSNNIMLILNGPALKQKLIKNAYNALNEHTYPNKQEYLEKYRESWDNCLPLAKASFK